MYSFAREVLIPHLETHLGWKCPVVNVTTFIVVKAGTVDVEKNSVGTVTLTSAMLPVRINTMLFACSRCSAPHPMMVVTTKPRDSPTCFGMQPNNGGCLLCCYTGYLGIFSSFLV